MLTGPDQEELLAIEAAAARAWPAIETVAFQGWLLRHSGAGSRRLRSVQTLSYHGGSALAPMIETVEAWYKQRAAPSCFRLTDNVQPPGLDAKLDALGYRLVTPTSIMTTASPTQRTGTVGVELLATADERVLRAICDPAWSSEVRQQRAELFSRIEPVHRFALVMDSETAVAAGLCVVDAGLAGLFTMRTQPSHRGRGLARAMAYRLIDWAREGRPRLFYLQVEDDNAPALHLYAQLGFARSYGYHYREKLL